MYKPLGELGKIVKLIKKILEKEYNDFNGKKDELNFIINKIYNVIIIKYPQTKFNLVEDIIMRFFDCEYKKIHMSFENGYNGFRNWDSTYNIDEIKTKTIKVPEKYKKLETHFQYKRMV